MKYILLSSILCLTLTGLLGAQDPRSSRIFGPHQTDGGILFRYYLPGAQEVFIAGDWSGWEPAVKLTQGKKPGYFEGIIPLFSQKKYRYKLIVDSIWQHDKENPQREYDISGDEISWFSIDQDIPHYNASPEKVGRNQWKFHYRNNRAESVVLVGSFNRYNPYEASLERDSRGVWTVTVQVLPGEHHYCFVVDGVWKTDPERVEKSRNRFGQTFSRFIAD
jgi:1,4-alpha-glucan branching enzyme